MRQRDAFRGLSVCLGAVLLAGVACTQITGSGRIVTKQVEVASFSRIEVSDVFDVSVAIGEPEKVTLRVDDNLTDHLDVGVAEGTLRLRLEASTSVRHATLHADVIARSLSGIEVSGSSKVHLSRRFTIDSLEVTLSGASVIDGSLACGSARVELSGASNATLSGSAEVLVLQGSGASQIEARRLQSRHLTVGLSGASEATVWATDTISAEVPEASSLRYRGSPRFARK